MRAITFPLIGIIFIFTACNKPPTPIKFDKSRSIGAGAANGDKVTETVSPTALAFTTAFPRLTQLQWENSVRDVLLLDAQPNLSSLFPSDPQNTFFANDGNSLTVSDGLWQSYTKAAETMANRVAADAALVARLVPTEAMALTGDAKATAIITPLATRAFRRPPTTSQMSRLLALYNNGTKLTDKKDVVAAGLQAVVQVLLESPYFIYRVELGKDRDDLTPLTAWEVASRLSYAAWNTIPDQELFQAAASGELLTDEGLAKQAARLMNDPRADANLSYFYKKIFGTDSYADVIKKDPEIAKSWPDDMGKTLVKEAELFIDEVIIKEKGGLNQLLTAPYAFVNSETAPFYNVPPPSGTDFVKMTLNPKERIGFLTQIGFLARRALEKESNAIRRGVLVADKLLCADITANVPAVLPTLEPPTGMKTSRDIVNEKSGPGTCGAACHTNYINPSGYAFENFDAAGNYRTTDNGQPVNAAAELTLKTGVVAYAGPQDFVKKITASSDLHNCMVEKAVGFLYAREVDPQDASLVKNIGLQSAANISTRDMFIELLSDSRIKLRGNKGK